MGKRVPLADTPYHEMPSNQAVICQCGHLAMFHDPWPRCLIRKCGCTKWREGTFVDFELAKNSTEGFPDRGTSRRKENEMPSKKKAKAKKTKVAKPATEKASRSKLEITDALKEKVVKYQKEGVPSGEDKGSTSWRKIGLFLGLERPAVHAQKIWAEATGKDPKSVTTRGRPAGDGAPAKASKKARAAKAGKASEPDEGDEQQPEDSGTKKKRRNKKGVVSREMTAEEYRAELTGRVITVKANGEGKKPKKYQIRKVVRAGTSKTTGLKMLQFLDEDQKEHTIVVDTITAVR